MKRLVIIIITVIIVITMSSCIETYDVFKYEDIIDYVEKNHQIAHVYHHKKEITTTDFMIENQEVTHQIANTFYMPKSGAYRGLYSSGHQYYLVIAKDIESNYKYIIFNLTVTKGTKLESSVAVLDYHLPYTFEYLKFIYDQMKNEYYKDLIHDIINDFPIYLESDAINQRQFRASVGYVNSIYEKIVVSLEEIEQETVLKISAKEKNQGLYTIYTSNHDIEVKKYEVNMALFHQYFEVELSFWMFYQTFEFRYLLVPNESIYYHHLMIDAVFEIRYLPVEQTEVVLLNQFVYVSLNNTTLIKENMPRQYEAESVTQSVTYREITGVIYIIT